MTTDYNNRLYRSYEVAMSIHADKEEAIRVVAMIFGADVETVRSVVEEREEA